MSKQAWETASARRPPGVLANIWFWWTGHYLGIVCLKPVKKKQNKLARQSKPAFTW